MQRKQSRKPKYNKNIICKRRNEAEKKATKDIKYNPEEHIKLEYFLSPILDIPQIIYIYKHKLLQRRHKMRDQIYISDSDSGGWRWGCESTNNEHWTRRWVCNCESESTYTKTRENCTLEELTMLEIPPVCIELGEEVDKFRSKFGKYKLI